MKYKLATILAALSLAAGITGGAISNSTKPIQVMSPSHCWIDNYSQLHCYVQQH